MNYVQTEVTEAPAEYHADDKSASRPGPVGASSRTMDTLLAAFVAVQAEPRPAPLVRTGRTPTGLAPWQILRVRNYVETELSRPIQVACLARIARLSASHFARAFKASFGMTPASYVVVRRIERAKLLMLDTHEPLCRISLDCGFTDQSHLSRVFRRRVGSSPSRWRRLHLVL